MVRLNQAALDLLQVELRRRVRSTYAQVNFSDALQSIDGSAVSTPASPAEAEAVANELIAHRLKRLHDSQGNPVTYQELRQSVIDLIPNFPDAVLRKAAKLNRPVLTEMPSIWPSVPLVQWSNLVLGAVVGGVGVLAFPFLQTSLRANLPDGMQNWNLPRFSTLEIAEVQPPQSVDLIPTAETFAGIVRQRMQAKTLSMQEWQSVVAQWQDAIDLLEQVPIVDREYAKAQSLVAAYKQLQIKSEQRLAQERQAYEALKSAKGRANWLRQRIKAMTLPQKQQAIGEIEQRLKPIDQSTTAYGQGQALLRQLKQQMK